MREEEIIRQAEAAAIEAGNKTLYRIDVNAVAKMITAYLKKEREAEWKT